MSDTQEFKLPDVGEGLTEAEIVSWKVKPGDSVTLKYFKPEVEGIVEETQATFKLKAIVPLAGAAADPYPVPAPERTVRAVPLVLTVPVAALAADAPSMITPALAAITSPLRLIQATPNPSLRPFAPP